MTIKSKEGEDFENQVIKVKRHKLESLIVCIETAIALYREPRFGQQASDTLLSVVAIIQTWIENASNE